MKFLQILMATVCLFCVSEIANGQKYSNQAKTQGHNHNQGQHRDNDRNDRREGQFRFNFGFGGYYSTPFYNPNPYYPYYPYPYPYFQEAPVPVAPPVYQQGIFSVLPVPGYYRPFPVRRPNFWLPLRNTIVPVPVTIPIPPQPPVQYFPQLKNQLPPPIVTDKREKYNGEK